MSNPKYVPLSYEDFIKLLRYFNRTQNDEDNLLFSLYEDAVEVLNLHQETFINMPFAPLEHGRLILFLIFDYDFRLFGLTFKQKVNNLEEDNFRAKLLNAVIDKYGSESYFKYREGKLISPFSMEISTINVYLNFILLQIPRINVSSKEMQFFVELLRNAFSLCRTISELLVSGFEKEALSSWRTLHELEATLLLLQDVNALKAYQKHIMYNAAFNRLLPAEEGDALFVQMKEEMKDEGLKSKDIRRYIEYGWISKHKDYDPQVNKYNFRDGVEMLAKRSNARDVYQIASEVSHSSPLMLFTDRTYFLRMALVSLYESFLIIEALFAELYTQNADKTAMDYYLIIRDLYLEDIKFVVKRITNK